MNPDPAAYRDDMAHAANLLDDNADGPVLDYVAQFLSGVARSADDGQLAEAATALASSREKGAVSHAAVARVAGLVQDRLSSRLAI